MENFVLELRSRVGPVRVFDARYSFSATEGPSGYPLELNLSGGANPMTVAGVELSGNPRVIVGAESTTSVHPRSAVVVTDRLLLAIGNHVVCFRLDPFAHLWSREVDIATCFGLHYEPDRSALISHGELLVSRFDLDGRILWQEGGRDIFTGSLVLKPGWVEVSDFDGAIYRFRYEDGSLIGFSSNG